MARKDNRIATKDAKITLPWPRWAELDRAIALGKYGTTFTSAAAAAVEKHLDFLIESKKIAGLTADELAAGPNPDYVQPKPKRKARAKT